VGGPTLAEVILLVLAIVAFLARAFGANGRIDWQALGFAFVAASLLIETVG
jgi:hypothetical protein